MDIMKMIQSEFWKLKLKEKRLSVRDFIEGIDLFESLKIKFKLFGFVRITLS